MLIHPLSHLQGTLAIAPGMASSPSTILHPECVRISFPQFFDLLISHSSHR